MELMLKTLTMEQKEKMVDAFAKLDSVSDAISIAERKNKKIFSSQLISNDGD